MRRLLVLLLVLAAVGLAATWFGYQRLKAAVESGALEQLLADKAEVELGIRPSFRLRLATFPEVAVEDLRIPHLDDDVLRLRALKIRLDPSRLTEGEVRIEEVRLEGPRIKIAKLADGTLNVKDLVARIKAHRARLRDERRTDFQRQLDEIAREAEALDRALPDPEGASRETPTSAAVEPARKPPTREDARRASPVVLRQVALRDAELRFSDASLGADVFHAALEDLDVTLTLPERGGRDVNLDLDAVLLGVPLEVDAALEMDREKKPAPVTGDLRFRLGGLPLGTIQPYLAARGLPVDLGRIPLHLSGHVVMDGKPTDYTVDLRIPESTIQVTKGELDLPATLEVKVGVRPDLARIERVRLGVGEALGLVLTGEVVRFSDPGLSLRARTDRFDLDALLALAPARIREKVAPLSPQLALALDATVQGRIREKNFLPRARLTIGPGKVAPKLGDEPLPVELDAIQVALDGDALAVNGLGVSVAGVKVLTAALEATELTQLPRVRLALGVPPLDVDALARALPGKVPLKTEKARAALAKVEQLAPRGMLRLDVDATANLPVLGELPELAGVGNLKDLKAAFAADPGLKDRLKDKPTLARLVEQGLLEAGVSLDLEDLRVTVKKDDLVVPVRAGLHLEATPAGARLDRLEVDALGARLAAVVAAESPLTTPTISAAVDLTGVDGRPLEIPSVLARLPSRIRDKAAALDPHGTLKLSVRAQGPVTAPELGAELALEDVSVRKQIPEGGAVEVFLPRLAVGFDGEAVTLGPATLRTPVGDLVLRGGVSDLKGARPFRVRLATTKEGLDPTRAIPLLPAARRARLERLDLDPTRVRLDVRAAGTPLAPAVDARVGLETPVGGLDLRAEVEDLKGAKELKATLRTTADGFRIEDVVTRLPPEVRAKIRGPLAGRLTVDLRAGGALATPESLKVQAGVTAALPGGDLRLKARVADPKGQRQVGARLEGSFSRLAEIAALLPPRIGAKLDELSARAEVGLDVRVTGDKAGYDADVEAGLKHAGVIVRRDGLLLPISVEPAQVRAKAHIVPRPGQRPKVDVDAGLEVAGLLEHPEKGNLRLRLDGSGLTYDGDDLQIGRVALQAIDQTVTVTGSVRGLKGPKKLDLNLDAVVGIQEVVRKLVPPEAKLRTNGTLAITAHVGGSAARPDWQGKVQISDLFLDAFQLRGHPLSIDSLALRVLRDDLILEPFRLSLGSRGGDFFLEGSMKELAKVENFWQALKEDKAAVVERLKAVAKAKGGKKAVVAAVGNDTLLRVLGSSAYKMIIHIDADDLPRTHTFKTLMLTPDETRDFEFRKEEILAKYERVALEEIYGKLGSERRLFGRHQSQAQVFPVKQVYSLVLDDKFNMVHPEKIPFWRLVVTPTKF